MIKNATVITLLAALVFWSCSTVPITGRQQLSLIPSSQMLSMSFQQYDEFLKTNKLSTNKDQTAQVKRVGANIRRAVEQYFTSKGLRAQLADYRWDVNLVESEQVNAWCMPGGKIVVYSGILPITKTEAGLAVVMGHEVAHAIAEHGNERMSQGLLAQLGGMGLSAALQNKPQETQAIWMTAFSVGAQYGVLLPFSRTQESEADEIGLTFMAMAGYDPAEAIPFWQRMSAHKGGQSVPEFMSTHPSDASRMAAIQARIPEARKYYKK